MTQATFTPGPWKVSWIGRSYGVRLNGSNAVSSGDFTVAICPEERRLGESAANARLIAKAPDLLESCKEWLDILDYLKEKYPDIEFPLSLRNDGTDAAGRLRAAIAEATQE